MIDLRDLDEWGNRGSFSPIIVLYFSLSSSVLKSSVLRK
jgi:hypothetical protein